MQYLLRNRKPNKIHRLAHLWTGKDTVCKMASTKGLDIDFYKIADTWEGRICNNCLREKVKHV